MIEDLLKENIIKKADQSGPFLSNAHGVAKPDKIHQISGKTDLYLLKQEGVATNHSRLCLDLRNLNRHCVGRPKINLPSHRDLIDRFANHNITTIDLCSQYWAITTDYSCQNLTNFWYDKEVYAFTRLPMGYSNSAFIAQTASELTYGQATMLSFIKMKGWKQGSVDWPFHDISEILIIYLDDLCLTTEKTYENADQVHINAIEFILYATKLYGFKIGKGKFKPWSTCFKFLGHQFDVSKSTNSIPPDRLKAFKDFRSPVSCAEMLSRLGVLSY